MFLSIPTGPPLKIGIIRSSSIGDVILATSCLHLLKQLKMPVEVHWLGRNPALAVIKEAFPDIRCLDLEEGSQREALESLEGLSFLVDLQTNLRSRLLARAFKRAFKRPVYVCSKAQLSRGRMLLESRLYGRRRSLSSRALHAKNLQYRMMTEPLRQALAEHLPVDMLYDLKDFDPFPQLPTAHDSRLRPWQKELRFGTWLAVAPGASYETKRAPMSLFAQVIAAVRDQHYSQAASNRLPLGLLCLGDSNDRKIIVRLLEELSWSEPVLNLAGKISLWENALALQGQAALLSNDSALAHMGEAVGTPVAVLFGPTVEGFGFAPRLAASRAFSAALGCRPCSKHGKSPCRYQDHLCFKSLSSEAIASHLTALIGDRYFSWGEDPFYEKKDPPPPPPSFKKL